VWVGHSNSGPGGAFLGVGVGGVWDFDTALRAPIRRRVGRATSTPTPRAQSGLRPAPEWALDFGNMINKGNTALWHARDLAGRAYVKVGCVSAWHPDDMAGIKRKLSDGAEPSAVPSRAHARPGAACARAATRTRSTR
jgi:hypothetical protein